MKICPKCKTIHEKNGTFCSRKCANARTWTIEDKKKKSESLRRTFSLSKSPGPKLSSRICIDCGNFIRWRNGGKLFCSKSCQNEFHKKQRTPLQEYRKQCSFRFNVFDFPNDFDLALVSRYGWYSACNNGGNIYGVSRDHRVSVNFGFKNNVDPKIISHPANCELLLHEKNKKKNRKCSMTLEELKSKISKWEQGHAGMAEIDMRGTANSEDAGASPVPSSNHPNRRA